MKTTLQDVEHTLLDHVRAGNVEGAIRAIETLLLKTKPNPNRCDTQEFRDCARVIGTASQVVDIRTKGDYLIQSLLLSGLMGLDAFQKRVQHLRLDLANELRRTQAQSTADTRTFSTAT